MALNVCFFLGIFLMFIGEILKKNGFLFFGVICVTFSSFSLIPVEDFLSNKIFPKIFIYEENDSNKDSSENDSSINSDDFPSEEDTTTEDISSVSLNTIKNITGSTTIKGSIREENQKDKYKFATSLSGTYRFDTDLSTGGKVLVRISGETGSSIKYNTNSLTADLEAGKTYILSIEYKDSPCNYTVFLESPCDEF